MLIALALGLSAAVAAPALAADEDSMNIIAFGDSLIAGYGLAAADSFPARLEEALRARGYRVRVENAGVSGDTSAGGRARLDWVLADRPDALILCLGANDALRGVAPSLTEANLDAMLTTLAARDIPVLLAGMLAPRNLGAEYAHAFNAIYPALAQRHEVVFFPFFLQDVATRPALNQGDGIHPNDRGVAAIVKNILPFVERLIARTAEG